jgi:NAD(P)-dependent dehydrogenase (short-subunit alcohol dehydrogenase family)
MRSLFDGRSGEAVCPVAKRQSHPLRQTLSGPFAGPVYLFRENLMATVLITGANRGIGLQLTKQFAERGDDVIAACREASDDLKALGVRVIDGIDVGNAAAVETLRQELGDVPIDILVNNAGILRRDSFGAIDYDVMMDQYRINTLGPLRVTEALAGNLREGSKVAIISSRVGSIDDNQSGGNWGYRASKTAVNMIGTNLRHELQPRGITVALLHPGLVATDMTGGSGIAAADSARGLLQRIDELTLETSGGFWHAEGYALPW